jgi:hypothetical protein
MKGGGFVFQPNPLTPKGRVRPRLRGRGEISIVRRRLWPDFMRRFLVPLLRRG